MDDGGTCQDGIGWRRSIFREDGRISSSVLTCQIWHAYWISKWKSGQTDMNLELEKVDELQMQM